MTNIAKRMSVTFNNRAGLIQNLGYCWVWLEELVSI